MKNYKYYLFDWDGCLERTLEVWVSAYRTAFKEYGVEARDQDILRHLGDWESPKYFGIADIQGCVAKIGAAAAPQLEAVRLYDGARELLLKLKESNKRLALLSSSKRDVLLRGLRHNGLQDCFEVILTAEDVVNHKPHPEIIQKGLAALGGTSAHAVMIGDSRKDLGAAQNAGIDSILFYPEFHRSLYDVAELRMYNPTYTISSFLELETALHGALPGAKQPTAPAPRSVLQTVRG